MRARAREKNWLRTGIVCSHWMERRRGDIACAHIILLCRFSLLTRHHVEDYIRSTYGGSASLSLVRFDWPPPSERVRMLQRHGATHIRHRTHVYALRSCGRASLGYVACFLVPIRTCRFQSRRPSSVCMHVSPTLVCAVILADKTFFVRLFVVRLIAAAGQCCPVYGNLFVFNIAIY